MPCSRRQQCLTDSQLILDLREEHESALRFPGHNSQPCNVEKQSALSMPGVSYDGSSLPHQVFAVTLQNSRAQKIGCNQHPAQAEWEKLWYHGISGLFQKVRHYFPAIQISGQPVNEQSISEPTLDINDLKKEEQLLFKARDRSETEPFAPESRDEIDRRLELANSIQDERQRQAVLLGLPTFQQYLEQQGSSGSTERDPSQPSKRQLKKQAKFTGKQEAKVSKLRHISGTDPKSSVRVSCMTHTGESSPRTSLPAGGASHRPLVVGLTRPSSSRSASTMASSSETAAINKEMAENVKTNTSEAAPAEDNTASSSQKPKKEKAPKQPKPQKAAAPVAPTSPALIDLRVGHILRAIAHPNADSLYVSTIAMGDPEGTDHTQVDEETGKVVRTVCSGLNGLVPLEEMQDRKIIVVANLKPVNMRSIKSAAMVLAASPKQPEGADPHAPDRVVELVLPPEGAEAGDKVYFDGWPYGEGKGPEKQLNPKKKQWEAIQPGFYTGDDLVVGFDAGQCDEVEGSEKGKLVVEGKGACTVKTLKGAVVR